jgi:putative methanogenesis marker 16 metalloprotein
VAQTKGNRKASSSARECLGKNGRRDYLKRIAEINKKIKEGKAVILTIREFKEKIRRNEAVKAEDVDVVTTATCALMSGTAAIMSVPVAERGAFERAHKVWLNGVPAYPGPCPNERLGIVDVIVYGTAHSISRSSTYGGGHLFRELVEGKEVDVKVENNAGKTFVNRIRLNDLDFAKMFTTRSAFKNYMAFLNSKEGEIESIFSVTKLKGPYNEISVSGCGEINPVENDPMLRTIGAGTKVLLNGARGHIIGEGTRSNKEKPNLSIVADMFQMDPTFMGGFNTSKGPECITSVAIPIPVLDEEVFSNLKISDENIKLPIADIHDRIPFTESNYGEVWRNSDFEIYFDATRCQRHEICEVERYCPTNAFSKLEGLDQNRCFNCGTCVYLCPEHAFIGNLGSIKTNGDVPITLRQSDRMRANILCDKLKKMILRKQFLLAEPVENLR